MSSTQQPKSDSDRGIDIDAHANDLVHIGVDTRGHNHYLDEPRDRILVVDAEHDETSPEDSVMVRRTLTAAPADVVHVQDDGPTDDLERYTWFVHDEVADRDWAHIAVSVIGGDLPPADAPEAREVVCELRAGAVALGQAPTPDDMDDVGPYTPPQVLAVFDDWEAALAAAGIDSESGELVDDLETVLDRAEGDA